MPTVKFSTVPIKLEVEMMYWFLIEEREGWGLRIIRKHPRLSGVYSIEGKQKREAFIRAYILKYRKAHSGRMASRVASYKRRWRVVEKQYFALLETILGTKWPKNLKQFKALTSINIICPRFLESNSFFLFVNYRLISHAIETIMHETCHFLYFKKFAEVFPDVDRKTFESPFIEWHLSELIAPIILNDERVQKLLRQRAFFYDEHERVMIGSQSAPKFFTSMYKEYMKQGDFAGFLKASYAAIKDNKKQFIDLF